MKEEKSGKEKRREEKRGKRCEERTKRQPWEGRGGGGVDMRLVCFFFSLLFGKRQKRQKGPTDSHWRLNHTHSREGKVSSEL